LRMDEDLKIQAVDSALQSPSETLLSIRLLDFKTSLLEAIEELRIRRETEINYEDQLSKIVVEKQELAWQKETLQHQTDTLQQQNKEAMTAFKKQFQARMFAVEEEKGRFQLAVEIKEKEIDGLKETLKELQISKYTLQKKLNEMDQKLQMHLTAREEHHKKLNEVERCYATIANQFGIVKSVHGKLEHSVQEAIQLNKKLTSVNERQEAEILNLKEELKKVTTDLIRSKVTSQYRVGEENINLAAKEKQFQELQQKIRMETAMSERVQEENMNIKEEKLEILSSLQSVQEQLQRITQMNVRMESELNALREEYQALERDNELQREKAKENEEKFLNLQNEHENALRIWKKDEEKLRREILAIKNELNSLKEVQGHPEDCHPTQGNHCSEQAENVQSGQEQSKDSEIQIIQKENDCVPSILRKDSIFGHEDETEVKNTVNFSLSIDEFQIKQKNTLTLTELQVLENSFKDEINVASPLERKQREASPRNTLCTDTDLITQGQNSEMHVTECKEAEDQGTTCRVLLEENSANLQQKLQDSIGPAAARHTETSKVLLDATDSVVVWEKNTIQEMNSSNQELCNTTHESTCTEADKNPSIIEHNNSVLASEASKKEPEAPVCAVKNAVCERNTDNQANEFHFDILSYAKNNSQTEYQKCSLPNSDNDAENRSRGIGESLLNLSGLPRDKFPFKQTHINTEDKSYNDDTTNINRSGTLRHVGFPATDARNLLAIYHNNVSTDEAAKEHSSNVPLTGALCPGKIHQGINVDDVHSKKPEQDDTEQSGGDRIMCAEAMASVKAMSPAKADEITVQNIPVDGVGTDKLNEEIQIQSIKNGCSLEVNDNSINNTMLKQKKDLLHSTVPGRKFAEGHLKESCSLPMRTSGNLVNVSGRSSFDLSTSDKKAEKTSVCFKFLDLSSCSRVNQVRSQATWISSSQEPSVLKEKLPCLVENKKVISKALFQNVSENIARREIGPGSTSSNGAADTLNTSSIHRDPQGDPTEEWNAIAKTFYDSSFPTEHVKEGYTALNEQKSSPMTGTPAQSERTLGDEANSPRHNSAVQHQIEEIEKFLHLERLCSSRKRKYEDK
ncbi:CCD73 protein, partial [Odontophorus gujanensis]|nr:CCD73 protein [Odontophorus gujanensis]